MGRIVTVCLALAAAGGWAGPSIKEAVSQAPLNLWTKDSIFRAQRAARAQTTFLGRALGVFEDPDDQLPHDGVWQKWQRRYDFLRDRVMEDGTPPEAWAQWEGWQKEQSRSSHAGSFAGRSLATSTVPVWRNINQRTCTGGYNGMGRSMGAAFGPGDSNKVYIATPAGGVWKSTDGGRSYVAIGDSLPYTACGAIIADWKREGTLYAVIGDVGGWWNYSLGVMKSTDDGASWKKTGLSWNLSDNKAIFQFVQHPTNPDLLLVASTDGIWRTVDGAATWTRVKTGGHRNVAFHPTDPAVAYASDDNWGTSAEFWRSQDTGRTWTQTSHFGVVNTNLIFAVTPASPDRVVASMSTDKSLWTSDDRGATWAKADTALPEYGVLAASPTKPGVYYCGGVNIFQTKTGGKHWQQIANWAGGSPYPEVHADQHPVAWNPRAKDQIWFNTDGGPYRYSEANAKFAELTNGLVITQFYGVSTSQTSRDRVIGGTQDNGGRVREADGSWRASNGGDAMVTAMDPTDENVFYTTYCNGQLYRTKDGWRNDTYKDISPDRDGDWAAPYLIDPNDHAALVAGYKDVFRSSDMGTTWSKISSNLSGGQNLRGIAVAFGDSKRIWASQANKVFRTLDGGATWSSTTLSGNMDVPKVFACPWNKSVVWAVRAGYTAGNKLWESRDAGATWNNISGTLPNVPCNFAMADTATRALYVATDWGVYKRDSNQTDFVRFGTGLPNVPTTGLAMRYRDRVMRASTMGRGMWEVDVPLSSGPAPLRPARNPGAVVKGLSWKLWAGSWTLLPSFDSLKPTDSGSAANVDISAVKRSSNYGMRFKGWFRIPVDGTWLFQTESDDGAKLSIDDTALCGVDGIHGNETDAGNVRLAAGYHSFQLDWFQGTGGQALLWRMRGPSDTGWVHIPDSMLWRTSTTSSANAALAGDVRFRWSGPRTLRLSLPASMAIRGEAAVLDLSGRKLASQRLDKQEYEVAPATNIPLPAGAGIVVAVVRDDRTGIVATQRLVQGRAGAVAAKGGFRSLFEDDGDDD